MVETGRDSDKFMLRLPDGMRARIKAAADAAGRSMNAQIVAVLDKAHPALHEVNLAAVRQHLDQIEQAPDAAARQDLIRALRAQICGDR